MSKTIIYYGSYHWRYYLTDPFTGEGEEVSEREFDEIVGSDRFLVPMKYDEKNFNRQNFYLNDLLIGYRIRSEK